VGIILNELAVHFFKKACREVTKLTFNILENPLIYTFFLIPQNGKKLILLLHPQKNCKSIISNDFLFKLIILSNLSDLLLSFWGIPFLLQGSFNKGSISGIKEDPKNHFSSKMKQIINYSDIFSKSNRKTCWRMDCLP